VYFVSIEQEKQSSTSAMLALAVYTPISAHVIYVLFMKIMTLVFNKSVEYNLPEDQFLHLMQNIQKMRLLLLVIQW
jgi:hypothetical protein